MENLCIKCGDLIPPRYIGRRCPTCLTALLNATVDDYSERYTAKDLADLLGFTGEEQVRRMSRADKIPGRIPGIKQHLFIASTVNVWLKQNQDIPKRPSSPAQQEAYDRCENGDHDWLLDERFAGLAYTSVDGTKLRSDGAESIGYYRTCYFCTYSTFVASLYNY